MSRYSTVTEAYAQAWARRRVFVPLYMALRLLAYALIAPGMAATINLAVSLSDQPALTDQDIAYFILTPVGFLATLAVLSILLTVEVLSFAVMSTSLRYDGADRWHTSWAAFGFVVSHVKELLVFGLLFVLRVLLLVAPFALVAGVIMLWATGDYDINYYLTYKPPSFLAAVGIVAVILLALAFVLLLRLSSWALALHLVLFEGIRPRDAFGESRIRMQGKQTQLKIELVIWVAMRLAISLVIAFVAGMAINLIPITEGHLKSALTLSMAIVLLWGLALIVLSAVALGALAVLLDGFFDGQRLQAPDSTDGGSLRVRLALTVGVGIVAMVGGIWMGNGLLESVEADDEVEIIAHRGAAGSRPENTMASVVKAIGDEADWVEIDVQETADGEVVVMHDSDYMKLAGVNLTIWDATMADLAEIDIGSWFDPAYSDERTPTLHEVLQAARGKSKVLIELKYYGHDVDLENRVVAIVEELGMQDQVAVMSLKYPAVLKMRELRPEWRAGVLAATAVGNLTELEGDFLAVNAGMANVSLVNSTDAAGKDLYVWTVNDPLQMSKMISLGVDGLITDEPALARQVLAFRARLTPTERMLLWMTEELGLDLTSGEYRDTSP
ncbi:glycerophosphoryl diester phosphodiesterase membrane domain-containing protein [Tropicibacter sp. R16_0]|uniref:glycerophosphodiester phosphodiesterase n=1 Tax=Tropicibacter sp. R16_0 TaxID=2821102 RepID=UPI001ADAAD65|nr:glycerophosphoryl diester phosphodiesterase membrane domain-containing protein [Tropicibacter sp. R16_0]